MLVSGCGVVICAHRSHWCVNNLLFVYRPRFQSKCISEKQCEWGINVSPISACSLTKNCESMGADVAKNKPFNCIADRKADGRISKTYKQLIHSGGRRHHRPSRHVSKKKCCNVSCLVQREKNITKEESGKILLSFFFKQRRCAITENLLWSPYPSIRSRQQ